MQLAIRANTNMFPSLVMLMCIVFIGESLFAFNCILLFQYVFALAPLCDNPYLFFHCFVCVRLCVCGDYMLAILSPH